MSGSDGDEPTSVRAEAAEWFAKMRGPDAPALAQQFATWRSARTENEEAYALIARRWDQSAFLTHSSLGRSRDLDRAAIWPRRSTVRFAAAAAVLLLVLGSLAVGADWRWPEGRAGAGTGYISTGRDLRTVALPDGSHVTLDAGSAIRLSYSGTVRRVRLVDGRARFNIISQAGSPFVVDVDRGSVVGDAGQFDVGLADGKVNVRLWRGLLRVSANRSPVNQVEGRSRRLTSGQQLIFRPLQALPRPTTASPQDMNWTQGMLSFDRESLGEAAAMINRYNSVRIKIAPPIANLRISGGFHASDPHGFARAVSAMFKLSIIRNADGSLLLAPEIKA
jgi:transmembrane sensor